MNSGDVTTRFKKRCENYSRKDKEKLLELVTKRVDILESKVSNTTMNLQKAMCWEDIAREFNEGSSEYRDYRQLKELWKRMKYNSRVDLLRFIERGNLEPGAPNLDSLDDFTLILVRVIPDYFQMDSDPKVRLQCRELLTIDPKLIELRANKIHEILNESDTNGSITNSNNSINNNNNNNANATITTTTTNINNNHNNNSNDGNVNFHRTNENSSDEERKVFDESRMSCRTDFVSCGQTTHSIDLLDGNSRDDLQDTNMYVSSGHTNKRAADSYTQCQNTVANKNFENCRKRKIPLHQSLLELETNENAKKQLLEMAQKENEKELLILDIQLECEKQRLIKEKIEAENAELKQRMLLQILENQANQKNSYPPLMFNL